jgi:outer membrane protein assembly factor BamB
MNQYDKEFAPESVDEQVEQLLLQDRVQVDKATPQARMVRDLQDVYAEEEALAHVWNSLVEYMENKNDMFQQDIQDEQAEQPETAPLEGYPSIKPIRPARYSRFSLVAAVLLASLVVGSMVWVLTFLHHQNSQVAGPQLQSPSPSGVYIGAGNGIFRIDRQTHKVIWSHKFPAPPASSCGADGNCAMFGDLVLANNMLYVPLIDTNTLYALDANNGALRWSHNFQLNLRQTTVVDGKLYSIVFSASTPDDYYVYALNPVNGVEYNHYHLFSNNSGSLGFSIVAQTLYASSDNNLYAFNLADGKQIWHQQIDQKLGVFADLQVVNGVLYTSSTFMDSSASLPGYVYAFNAKTGTQMWRSPTVGDAYFVTVAENVIYLSTGRYELDAYNAQTGKELWQRSVGFYVNNIVVNAGVVYLGGSYGENIPYPGVVALNAKDGSIKWRTSDDAKSPNFSKPASGPVLVDGTLYVGDLKLLALNTKDGSAQWSLAVSGLDVPPIIITIVVAP